MKVGGQLHDLAALPKVKGPQYPLDRSLGRPQTSMDMVTNRKKSIPCPCQVSNSGHLAHSPVTTLTKLPWLQFLHSSKEKLLKISRSFLLPLIHYKEITNSHTLLYMTLN